MHQHIHSDLSLKLRQEQLFVGMLYLYSIIEQKLNIHVDKELLQYTCCTSSSESPLIGFTVSKDIEHEPRPVNHILIVRTYLRNLEKFIIIFYLPKRAMYILFVSAHMFAVGIKLQIGIK